MSNVESLRAFADFRAAWLWERGATDICHETEIFPVASTHPLATQLLSAQLLVADPVASAGARSRSLTGSLDIEMSESPRDEAPLSDFELLDDLRKPQGRMRRQIRALRGSGRLPYRERLARRLEFLLEAPEEEGEEWGEHSPESLRQMLLFLQDIPEFRYPTVAVTPSATFRAQWQRDKSEHFAVDFLPDGQVRFVVFAPDPRHLERVQRVSGVVSRADLKATVIEPYKVDRWAADART